jgi:hypothetical protein
MSTVTRLTADFRGRGNWIQPINCGSIVNRDSAVFVSICEVAFTGEPELIPWFGDAIITIENVVPRDDGTVVIRLQSNWETDLSMRVQLLVCND